MKRVDVACALIFDDRRENVLMVRNNRGGTSDWSLPGGAVELGETLEQAVRRETKEETGLDMEVSGLYSVREVFYTGSEHHALIFTFHSTMITRELASADPDDEILEVKWVDMTTANEIFAKLPVTMRISSEYNHIEGYSFHGNV